MVSKVLCLGLGLLLAGSLWRLPSLAVAYSQWLSPVSADPQADMAVALGGGDLPDHSLWGDTKLKLLKRLAIYCSPFAVVFVGVGYLYSDNWHAKTLVSANHLRSADDVFQYVIARKIQAPAGSPVFYGQSFKRMMSEEKNWLWCDEGAIAIAVLAGQLGYRTRLVDLHHRNSGVSYHTIVEILIDGRWRAFDFTGRTAVADPRDSVDYPSNPLYREYPRIEHHVLLNNYFLRTISEAWRGRHWPKSGRSLS